MATSNARFYLLCYVHKDLCKYNRDVTLVLVYFVSQLGSFKMAWFVLPSIEFMSVDD